MRPWTPSAPVKKSKIWQNKKNYVASGPGNMTVGMGCSLPLHSTIYLVLVIIALAILYFFLLNSIFEISSIDICLTFTCLSVCLSDAPSTNAYHSTAEYRQQLLGVEIETGALLFLLLHLHSWLCWPRSFSAIVLSLIPSSHRSSGIAGTCQYFSWVPQIKLMLSGLSNSYIYPLNPGPCPVYLFK